MFNTSDDRLGDLLREGLSGIPVPDPGAEFDARVRARLRRPEPRWQLFRNMVWPVLTPAACSMAVTLAVLIAMGTPKPGASPQDRPPTGPAVALDPGPDRERSIEQELERIDRDTPSLGGFGALRRPEDSSRDIRVRPRNRHGASRRRATRAWRA